MTTDIFDTFSRDGFVTIRSLFSPEDTTHLRSTCERDPGFMEHAHHRYDADGAVTRVFAWNHHAGIGKDIESLCSRVRPTMELLLDGSVEHFQTKLTAKDPMVGGSWPWHQDYWNWYHNGFLFPQMANVYIALDRATADNGCLTLVRGSHRLGRIDHIILPPPEGEENASAQARIGADPERVEQVMAHSLEEVSGTLEPGDALFFHCNLLHRSDRNRSEIPRFGLVCCFTAAWNGPWRGETSASG